MDHKSFVPNAGFLVVELVAQPQLKAGSLYLTHNRDVRYGRVLSIGPVLKDRSPPQYVVGDTVVFPNASGTPFGPQTYIVNQYDVYGHLPC